VELCVFGDLVDRGFLFTNNKSSRQAYPYHMGHNYGYFISEDQGTFLP